MTKETKAMRDTPTEAMRDAVIAAYKQGALDVHESWMEGSGEKPWGFGEPDFTEAAHDYADTAMQAARSETPDHEAELIVTELGAAVDALLSAASDVERKSIAAINCLVGNQSLDR